MPFDAVCGGGFNDFQIGVSASTSSSTVLACCPQTVNPLQSDLGESMALPICYHRHRREVIRSHGVNDYSFEMLFYFLSGTT